MVTAFKSDHARPQLIRKREKQADCLLTNEGTRTMSNEPRAREDHIEVSINCNIRTLRLLLGCVQDAYRRWPGGDAAEQVELDRMRSSLFVILYDAMLENDLV